MTDLLRRLRGPVYIAGRIIAQDRLRMARGDLRDLGWEVSSAWLDLAAPDYPATQEERDGSAWKTRARREALNDLQEVREATVIIVDTLDESPTGGREVELGTALCLGTHFIRVGPVRNIFHELADEEYASWVEFMETVVR